MKDTKISDSVIYIGADDKTLDLFESQYVIPNGVSYNSYLILDEKVTVMDTVDARATDEWLQNLDTALDGKKVDYLVVSHMEPDHAANVATLIEKFPELQVIGNAKTFNMIAQFFDLDLSSRSIIVKEGDTISLGTLTGRKSWLLMSRVRKFSSPQMDLENLGRWTQRKTGLRKQDAII